MSDTLIYLPTPVGFARAKLPRPHLASIVGQDFALLNNGWKCMDEITANLEALLMSKGARSVQHFRISQREPIPDAFLDEIAAKVTGAVTGLGN